MKHLKIIIAIALCSLFLVSCGNDDNVVTLPPNLGIYELQSLESDVAMDLDYDGLAAKDFKQELQLWWFSIPYRQQYAPLAIYKSDTNGRYLVRTLGMPRDDHDENDPDPSFRFKPADGIHSLFIENGEIVSFEVQEPFVNYHDPNDVLGQQRPYLIQFDSDNEVTMKLTQYFYDYTIDEWTQVNLVAKFDKIEDDL
jgi:hypothetical protein